MNGEIMKFFSILLIASSFLSTTYGQTSSRLVARAKTGANPIYTSYEGIYILQTPSATAKKFGLSKIIVKRILGSHTDYILTMDSGIYDINQTAGILSLYSPRTRVTSFNTGAYDWCDDYDCAGISEIKGVFSKSQNYSDETISMSVNYFKDNQHGGVKTWKETLVFKRN
jgi:hypothetical protein